MIPAEIVAILIGLAVFWYLHVREWESTDDEWFDSLCERFHERLMGPVEYVRSFCDVGDDDP